MPDGPRHGPTNSQRWHYMTDISRFSGWWDQLPVDTRLKMNKADMEFAWISSSNAHQQLEYQARHAAETERAAIADKIESAAMAHAGEVRNALLTVAEYVRNDN